MAGVEGFEPSPKLLESYMLPLHHTPILNCTKYMAGATGFEPIPMRSELIILPLYEAPITGWRYWSQTNLFRVKAERLNRWTNLQYIKMGMTASLDLTNLHVPKRGLFPGIRVFYD